MKRILIVTNVASMVDNFLKPNIDLLLSLGFEVFVCCNFLNPGTISKNKCDELKLYLKNKGVSFFHMDCPRSPVRFVKWFKSIKQIKNLLKKYSFDFVHAHSPMGSFVSRIAVSSFRKKGTRMIYTSHGFMFAKGGGFLNWLLYYPIEKGLSSITDTLICINKEDYLLSVSKFRARRVEYIPGVGVDLTKFSKVGVDKKKIRNDLGVLDNQVMLLSVGELSKRKNHLLVVKALSKINHDRFKYFIVGKGHEDKRIKKMIKKCHLEENVFLLGFRTDIKELNCSADLFVFPSFREGLPVALMEAISCGIPVICSNIRGNVELVQKTQLFMPNDVDGLARMLDSFSKNSFEQETIVNRDNLKQFSVNSVNEKMAKIYEQ